MIGDKGAELIAYARSLNHPTRMYIKPETKSPHVFMAGPDVDPDIILTNGQYHLVFHTKTRNMKLNIKKFDLVFDFGCKLLKFANYHEFLKQRETNKYVKFFFEYTNICEDMFTIAKLNEGMHIPITFKIVKYYRDVMKQNNLEDMEQYHMILNPFRETEFDWWGVNEEGKLDYHNICKEAKE